MNNERSDIPKKCGTCYHFIVKPDEIALAQHAPSIAACKPGMPHCLGGQVRGACNIWQERAEKGLPMPWGLGPMTESTFGCKLYEPGGPQPKRAGGFNKKSNKKAKGAGLIAAGLAVIGLATTKTTGSKNKQPFRLVLWEKDHSTPYALLDEDDNLLWAGEWKDLPLNLPSYAKLRVEKEGSYDIEYSKYSKFFGGL